MVPSARHAGRRRSVRDRARVSAHRRDRAGRKPGRHAICLRTCRNGDGGEIAYYLKRSRGCVAAGRGLHGWRQADGDRPGRQSLRALDQGRAAWARSWQSLLPMRGSRECEVVVPEAKLSADTLSVGRSRLYVQYRDGGPSVVKMFKLDGKALGDSPRRAGFRHVGRRDTRWRQRHRPRDELHHAVDTLPLRCTAQTDWSRRRSTENRRSISTTPRSSADSRCRRTARGSRDDPAPQGHQARRHAIRRFSTRTADTASA